MHLLSPSGQRNALAVEEGLATIFCDEISERHGLGLRSLDPPYITAKDRVTRLLNHDRDVVRKMRMINPTFRSWTAEFISELVSGLDPQLAEELCEPFVEIESRYLTSQADST